MIKFKDFEKKKKLDTNVIIFSILIGDWFVVNDVECSVVRIRVVIGKKKKEISETLF